MPHDVVVSYSRRNREIADRLAALLRERKLDVWYDRMIKPGSDWRDEIANAISHARIFLILFSAESNDSQELRKELAIADRRKLLIIPVRIEQVEPTGLFEYELARRQWFDIFADWRAGLPSVVDYIAEAVQSLPVGKSASPEQPSTERVAPIEERKVEKQARREPRPNVASESRLDPSPAPAFRARWRAFVIPVLGMLLGATAFVLAASADEDLAGGFAAMVFAPIWTLLQVFAARSLARSEKWSPAINWAVRALAVWMIALIALAWILIDDSSGIRSLADTGRVTGFILALGFLTVIGILGWRAVQGERAALSWLLPLFGCAILTFIWFGFDREFEEAAAIVGAFGMTIGGLGYLLEARSRAVATNWDRAPA